ncbi:hypothetical protein, partial [Acinetobacter baumannii]|uniref:hypothetical protein n=1 Tax=Acinetobacter baumannii TaxID=470 RepID=UPI001C09C483
THGLLSAKAKLKRMAGEAPDLARAAAGAPAGHADKTAPGAAAPGLAARAKAFFTEPDDDFPVAARTSGQRREPVVEATGKSSS